MMLINLNFLLIIITLKVFIDYSAQKKEKEKEEVFIDHWIQFIDMAFIRSY